MRTSFIVSAFAALTSLVSANPIKTKRSNGEVAVYWGIQNGSPKALSDYCASGQDIDILILSFLNNFGGGTYPSGSLGDCQVDSNGSVNNCDSLASDIQTCQAAGIKVFVSLGGGGATFSIDSAGDAEGIAYSLWYSYGQEQSGNSSPRPFGSVKLDGFDFDIESNPNGQSQEYLGTLINTLRGYFSQDTSKSYYISGAPQCVIPDTNMGNALMQAKFDYVFIQFYNNNCAAADVTNTTGRNPDGGNAGYNFDKWAGYLSDGNSSDAALFVGIPATTRAAPPFDYVQPNLLPQVFNKSPGYAGVMLWNAAQSAANIINGCTYAQNVYSVITTGSACAPSSKK